MKELTVKELAAYFDHTQLKAYAQKEDFEKLCREADEYGFAMVAINSSPVACCKELLKDSKVHVGAAISFPLGQTTIETKVFETKNAIENGADEIDYVIKKEVKKPASATPGFVVYYTNYSMMASTDISAIKQAD